MRSPGRGYVPDVCGHDACGGREGAQSDSGRRYAKAQARHDHAGQNR